MQESQQMFVYKEEDVLKIKTAIYLQHRFPQCFHPRAKRTKLNVVLLAHEVEDCRVLYHLVKDLVNFGCVSKMEAKVTHRGYLCVKLFIRELEGVAAILAKLSAKKFGGVKVSIRNQKAGARPQKRRNRNKRKKQTPVA